jgi:hypothetical protein
VKCGRLGSEGKSVGDSAAKEVNRQGDVLQRYDLKGDLFKQPEGLTFSANADLYISNEGGAGNGTILFFKYKQ